MNTQSILYVRTSHAGHTSNPSIGGAAAATKQKLSTISGSLVPTLPGELHELKRQAHVKEQHV